MMKSLGADFVVDYKKTSPKTTSSLTSGDTVIIGRNHDENLSNCLIMFNPSGLYKKGFEFENEAYPKWTAKYPPKDDRPVLDQIRFITYILDNCANTSEDI